MSPVAVVTQSKLTRYTFSQTSSTETLNTVTPARGQVTQSQQSVVVPSTSPASLLQGDYHYPNPGYLGSSSHSAIFTHFSTHANVNNGGIFSSSAEQSPRLDSHSQGLQVATLQQLLSDITCIDIDCMKKAIDDWMRTGANLSLAGPFVQRCAQAIQSIVKDFALRQPLVTNISILLAELQETLTRNSTSSIVLSNKSIFSDLSAQLIGEHVRWESWGLFFIAAARATLDQKIYPSLHSSDVQRHKTLKQLTDIGNAFLEICLSLDCLNDLQLILQYENYILHTSVYGDQSR